MDNLKTMIESLLFVADAPLSIDKIKSVLELDNRKVVREALKKLSQEYDEQGRAFFLGEVAGGYQLRTRPQYAQWARKLKKSKPPRLSKAAMETLAIIAYKQPVLRTDIEHLRGVDCGGIIRMLLERGVIRVLGRKDLPGRPLVYGTSKLFLEMFDLKDLKNLPTLKDIKELGEMSSTDWEDTQKPGQTLSDEDEQEQQFQETEGTPQPPPDNGSVESEEVWSNDSH